MWKGWSACIIVQESHLALPSLTVLQIHNIFNMFYIPFCLVDLFLHTSPVSMWCWLCFLWAFFPSNGLFFLFFIYQLYHGKLKNKKSLPKLLEIENKNYRHDRLTLIPNNETKDYNLTLIVREVEFDDAGRYICIVTNKKEKDTKSNATAFLTVLDKSECPLIVLSL